MSQPKPHWILVGVGALAIALIGAVAALGGPADAWLKTTVVIWGHPAPSIISMQPDPRANGTFILTIRNPALEDVIVTGYEATPIEVAAMTVDANAMTNADGPVADGAGAVPLVTPEEPKPEECQRSRRVRLARPLIIEPRRAGAMNIRPWSDKCPFEVRVLSDHGTSQSADTFAAMVGEYIWTEP